MMCVVKDCQTNNITKNKSLMNGNTTSTVTRYRFPKDPNLKSQWCSILGIREDDLCTHWKVCQLHFLEKDFKNPKSGRKLLFSNVLPSKNLGQITYCEPSIVQNDLKILKIQKTTNDFTEIIPSVENNDETILNKPKIFKITKKNKIYAAQDNYEKKIYETPKILKIGKIPTGFEQVIPMQENFGKKSHEKRKVLKIKKISTEVCTESTQGFDCFEIIPIEENYGQNIQETNLNIEKIISPKVCGENTQSFDYFEIIPIEENYEKHIEEKPQIEKISTDLQEVIPILENCREKLDENPKILKIEKITNTFDEVCKQKRKSLDYDAIIPTQEINRNNIHEKPNILQIGKITSGVDITIPREGNSGEKFQEKPKILKLEIIPNAFKKVIPIQENCREKFHEKPKILKITNTFDVSRENTQSFDYEENIPMQANNITMVQENPKTLVIEKTTNDINELTPIRQNNTQIRYRFSTTLKEAKKDENISTGDLIQNEYTQTIVLKNEVLRNTLKKRDRKINSLTKEISRKNKKISELQNTIDTLINEQFGVKKCKKRKNLCSSP